MVSLRFSLPTGTFEGTLGTWGPHFDTGLDDSHKHAKPLLGSASWWLPQPKAGTIHPPTAATGCASLVLKEAVESHGNNGTVQESPLQIGGREQIASDQLTNPPPPEKPRGCVRSWVAACGCPGNTAGGRSPARGGGPASSACSFLRSRDQKESPKRNAWTANRVRGGGVHRMAREQGQDGGLS